MGKIREWILKPRQWWKSLDRTSRQILLVLFGVAVVFLVPAAAFSGDWPGLFLNLGTELAGGAVTFVLLNEILGGRRRKAELIREMASTDNGIALRAVNELRAHGWLTDGSCNGAYLRGANLEGADLWGAHLEGANLAGANLKGVSLIGANLEGANLWAANLEGADLEGVNLKGVNLWDANLEGANLWTAHLKGVKIWTAHLKGANLWTAHLKGANLEGASLRDANLEGAALRRTARFHETTMLPDGTTWTPDTDMARFTDPSHPDFWRSDDPLSPAYRGHSDQGDG